MKRFKHGLKWVAGHRTPAKVYVTRVFNYGTWEEWQEMNRRFRSQEIQEAVNQPLRGQWTRRGKALAEALFDCKMPNDALISYDP